MSRFARPGHRVALVLSAAAVVAAVLLLQRNDSADSASGNDGFVCPDCTCAECEVQLDHVMTVGSLDGPDWFPEQPRTVARDSRGRLHLAFPMLEHLPVFDAAGRSLPPIGRGGEGPGEYQLPYLVRVDRADTVLIVDWTHQLSVVTPSGEFVRRSHIPVEAEDFHVTGEGSVVFSGGWMGADDGGRGKVFHVFNPHSAAVETSFHVRETESGSWPRRFHLGPAGDPDRFWTVSRDGDRYEVMQFATDGMLLRHFERSPAWLRAIPPDGDLQPPPSNVFGISESDGHLLIIGRHPIDDWTRYWNDEVFGEDGEASPSELQYTRLYRSVVEVVDVETGQLVTAGRIPGLAFSLLPDLHVAAYREDDAGVPFVDLFRMTVVGTPDAPQYGVRDSAGIRIAENPRPAPDSRLGWSVSTEPLLSIGTTEGESTFQLYRVSDATRLADGRIVVANGGSLELLVFDAEGSHLDSWGGRGEGPGEFARLNRVRAWAGDSLIAADPGRGRVSILDSRGSHGRTVNLHSRSEGEAMMPTAPDQAQEPVGLMAVGPDALIGVLPDGTLFTRDDEIVTIGFTRQDYAYALKTIDGEMSVVSLGTRPGPQTYAENFDAGGGFLFIPFTHPFGQTTHTAVWGDLAVLGRTETYEIRGYRSDGSLARIVRCDFEPGTPTRAEHDAWFSRLLAGYSEERREQRAQVAANVPLVDAFPAFGAVVGDALGYLWVAEFKRPGDEYAGTLWTVFDGDGRMLGLVETPLIGTVFEIGEDYILGEATDELGVEHVRIWGLDRQG